MLRSNDRVNVVIAGKHPTTTHPSDTIADELSRGLAIWPHLSDDGEPDLTIVCAGDLPATVTHAAVPKIRNRCGCRVRVVNIHDLTVLGDPVTWPGGLGQAEIARYFGEHAAVLVVTLGHPAAVWGLLGGRPHRPRRGDRLAGTARPHAAGGAGRVGGDGYRGPTPCGAAVADAAGGPVMTWEPLIDQAGVVDLRNYVGPGDDGLFVAVYAGGCTGWYGPVSEASGRCVQALLSDAVAGESVTEHQALADVLRNAAGRHCDRAMSWAIGAVDCAVWDLHGRLADLPVASLLAVAPMMPRTTASLPVTGTVAADSAGLMLVLSKRLDGHDTFLTGLLELDGDTSTPVRILTLDDVTVLRLTGTATLAAAAPLDPREARRILRHKLHTVAEITDVVRDDVCSALKISPSSFPPVTSPSPLRLVPGAVDTLRRLNDHGIVITLSNVTCVEADTDHLDRLLSPWVTGHFLSCRLGYAKPDPRAFRKVTTHYDANARHMVHIGDDWECDIIGATAVGAAAIWISGGRPVPDDRLLVTSSVLVADDLTQVTRHVRTLEERRS